MIYLFSLFVDKIFPNGKLQKIILKFKKIKIKMDNDEIKTVFLNDKEKSSMNADELDLNKEKIITMGYNNGQNESKNEEKYSDLAAHYSMNETEELIDFEEVERSFSLNNEDNEKINTMITEKEEDNSAYGMDEEMFISEIETTPPQSPNIETILCNSVINYNHIFLHVIVTESKIKSNIIHGYEMDHHDFINHLEDRGFVCEENDMSHENSSDLGINHLEDPYFDCEENDMSHENSSDLGNHSQINISIKKWVFGYAKERDDTLEADSFNVHGFKERLYSRLYNKRYPPLSAEITELTPKYSLYNKKYKFLPKRFSEIPYISQYINPYVMNLIDFDIAEFIESVDCLLYKIENNLLFFRKKEILNDFERYSSIINYKELHNIENKNEIIKDELKRKSKRHKVIYKDKIYLDNLPEEISDSEEALNNDLYDTNMTEIEGHHLNSTLDFSNDIYAIDPNIPDKIASIEDDGKLKKEEISASKESAIKNEAKLDMDSLESSKNGMIYEPIKQDLVDTEKLSENSHEQEIQKKNISNSFDEIMPDSSMIVTNSFNLIKNEDLLHEKAANNDNYQVKINLVGEDVKIHPFSVNQKDDCKNKQIVNNFENQVQINDFNENIPMNQVNNYTNIKLEEVSQIREDIIQNKNPKNIQNKLKLRFDNILITSEMKIDNKKEENETNVQLLSIFLLLGLLAILFLFLRKVHKK
ncbi:hypothetical protein H312_03306 [Anncaliia algerae PRA339]|uniref:Uncharacterized protein n=1 Tax=Anncaliia algerae PRA339 TaxID=1288291 RepID=A0A059EX43_9MICR|nr:hypothetical protein H312_03306 [Anncaliia algerae PRA339]